MKEPWTQIKLLNNLERSLESLESAFVSSGRSCVAIYWKRRRKVGFTETQNDLWKFYVQKCKFLFYKNRNLSLFYDAKNRPTYHVNLPPLVTRLFILLQPAFQQFIHVFSAALVRTPHVIFNWKHHFFYRYILIKHPLFIAAKPKREFMILVVNFFSPRPAKLDANTHTLSTLELQKMAKLFSPSH